MGKFLPFIFLLILLASSSLAAPKEEEGESVAAAVSAPEKKVASTERDVTTADDTWATFFSQNGYTLGSGLLGLLLVLGGFTLVGYYGLNVYGANTVDTGYTGNANYQGQPNYYSSYGYPTAAGRYVCGEVEICLWNFVSEVFLSRNLRFPLVNPVTYQILALIFTGHSTLELGITTGPRSWIILTLPRKLMKALTGKTLTVRSASSAKLLRNGPLLEKPDGKSPTVIFSRKNLLPTNLLFTNNK
jgi:hypothetical protein